MSFGKRSYLFRESRYDIVYGHTDIYWYDKTKRTTWKN